MFAIILSFVLWVAGAMGGELCPSQLGDAISAVLANCSNCQRAHWGIRVDLLNTNNGTTETLYDLDSTHYFLPASNNKLLTTTVAFHELGPDYVIETPIYVNQWGDICMSGRGDPSMTYSDLVNLADELVNLGIMQVRNVMLDESFYSGPILPLNWEWSDVMQGYGAQPSTLILDENVIYFEVQPGQFVGDNVTLNFTYEVDFESISFIYQVNMTEATVPSFISIDIEPESPFQVILQGNMAIGSDPLPISMAAINPIFRFSLLFSKALQTAQIGILGANPNFPCNPEDPSMGWKVITSTSSPTLAEMMNYTLLVSDNLYAETFMMHIGKFASDTNSTRLAGIKRVWETQTEVFGVTNGSFIQDDGSGLSRHNLVSPQSLVEVLTYAWTELENGSLYLSFLPRAGETGTLSNRFIGTPAEGVLHAKTGTLDGVNCLSGFVDHNDSEHPVLIFSIMANNAAAASITPIDEIGVLLASVVNC